MPEQLRDAVRVGMPKLVVKPPQQAARTPAWPRSLPRPSERRSDEDRVRRHRERTIATWLRSLG